MKKVTMMISSALALMAIPLIAQAAPKPAQLPIKIILPTPREPIDFAKLDALMKDYQNQSKVQIGKHTTLERIKPPPRSDGYQSKNGFGLKYTKRF